MLVLRMSAESYWLDLPMGVRLQVLPLGRSLAREAREDIEAAREGTEAEDEPGAGAFETFAMAVARRGIIAWEGVVTPEGDPADLTPDGVEALLDHPTIWTRFMQDYISPGFGVVAEGNVSAPSPNGTSAKAQTTARPAKEPAPTAPPA